MAVCARGPIFGPRVRPAPTRGPDPSRARAPRLTDTPDPTDAVVSIAWHTVAGDTITTEQGSGVLVAPDEVLTAAHLVYDAAGGIAPGIAVSGSIAGRPFGAAAASVRASSAELDFLCVATEYV